MAGESDFATAFAGAEGGEQPPDALEKLDIEVTKLIELEAYISETEESVKAAKAAANRIKQRTLPDIMAELRMDETTRDGWKIKLGTFVSGSLPNAEDRPEDHERAVAYLKKLEGGEDLLKTTLTAEFGKGQANAAVAAAEDILSTYGVMPKTKFGVPHQTLCAFVREKIENSEAIDTDILGIYCGTAVKVTAVKPKKAKK